MTHFGDLRLILALVIKVRGKASQVEDRAEIRRLQRTEQTPVRAIARHLSIPKNTVKRALANDRPPYHRRPAKGSAVDAVEMQIRELLREPPTMCATVIAERIGWEPGMAGLKASPGTP